MCQEFVRASDNKSDPVGRFGNDWGFWDETWSGWNGGFSTEAAARQGLQEYCERYL